MSDIDIIDKWINVMLKTIRDNKLGPTYVARFQYLVSVIIYYVFVCFTKAKNNCVIEPELQIIYLDGVDSTYVDCMIYNAIGYLYDLHGYDKTFVQTKSKSMNNRTNMVIDNLKRFLDRRNADGWKTANNQPTYPNGNAFIDVENAQDLNTLLPNKHQWTPLKHKNGVVQKYLTPEWGKVVPVENIDITKYNKIADDNYVESQREYEIAEILKEYENLNDKKRMIAEYFQGGQVTPPGIWNIWGLYAIRSANISALDASKFLYLLNSAMFTASVACWGIKRKYMQARPIQEIRILPKQKVVNFDGKSVDNNIWKTFQQQDFQVPPFPDRPSGHSTFSSSAAVIFDKFFPNMLATSNFTPFSNEHGTMISQLLSDNPYSNTVKTIMVKTSSSAVVHDTMNMRFPICAVKLEFTSWRNLAELSGISRIYGGIHGNEANNLGLIIGEEIAVDILNRSGN
jgi:hypothetical protein